MSAPELIKLNVGGRLFTTTRSTLTKHPDSMLAAMFRGDMQAGLADGLGHPFLDRDPTHFPTILAFLRDNQVPPLPEGRLERHQLKAEAGFYALTELVAAIDAAEEAAVQQRQRAEAAEESRQLLETQRAQQVRTACQAVERAEAEWEAGKVPLEQLWGMQEEERDLQAELERVRLNPRGWDLDIPHDARLAQAEVEEAREELFNLRDFMAGHRQGLWPELVAAEAARVRLRQAQLVRLCALGADMATAKEMLATMHPHLMKSVLGPEAEAGA